MVILLISLVGVPPLGGFVGKFLLFGAAIDARFAWLAVVAILNGVLSLAIYLRIVVPMYQVPKGTTGPRAGGRGGLGGNPGGHRRRGAGGAVAAGANLVSAAGRGCEASFVLRADAQSQSTGARQDRPAARPPSTASSASPRRYGGPRSRKPWRGRAGYGGQLAPLASDILVRSND